MKNTLLKKAGYLCCPSSKRTYRKRIRSDISDIFSRRENCFEDSSFPCITSSISSNSRRPRGRRYSPENTNRLGNGFGTRTKIEASLPVKIHRHEPHSDFRSELRKSGKGGGSLPILQNRKRTIRRGRRFSLSDRSRNSRSGTGEFRAVGFPYRRRAFVERIPRRAARVSDFA